MTTSAHAPNTRQCPACGESILAIAKKCKHCGERFSEVEHIVPIVPTVPSMVNKPSKKNKRLLKLGMMGIFLGAALIAFYWVSESFVANSVIWVGLHSDVMWHRNWQDKRIEHERTKVVDIYDRLRSKHPNDANWEYLAIRSLPEGAEKHKQFEDVARKFDKNPWILWGVATSYSDQENDQDTEHAVLRYKNAIEAFGQNIPAFAMEIALIELSKLGTSEDYESFYKHYANYINNTGEAARGMVVAEWSQGHQKSALSWESKAERLGTSNEQKIRRTSLVMGAINIRNDIVSANGRNASAYQKPSYGTIPVLEIKDFAGREEGENYFLIFWLSYLAFDSAFDGAITRDDVTLHTLSGQKYSAWKGTTAVTSVTAGKQSLLTMTYSIPKSERVSKLLLDTKRTWKDSGEGIIIEVPLEPQPDKSTSASKDDDVSIYPN